MAWDGYGPADLGKIHPRFPTPALAIITFGGLSLRLALSGSFVQLALLSVVARLFTYIGTSVSVLVLSRRYGDREQALHLPGAPLIPIAAPLLSIVLLASSSLISPVRRVFLLFFISFLFLFFPFLLFNSFYFFSIFFL